MRAWYALEGDEEARSVEARLEELEQAGLVSKEVPPVFTERAALRPCEHLPDVPAHLPVAGRGRRFRDLIDRRAASA